jgi:hypothetical protein
MTLSSVSNSPRHYDTLEHWELLTQWYKHPGIFKRDTFIWCKTKCDVILTSKEVIQLQVIYLILIWYIIYEYNNVASTCSRYMSWQLFQLDRSTDFDHTKCSYLFYLHSNDFINLKFCNKHWLWYVPSNACISTYNLCWLPSSSQYIYSISDVNVWQLISNSLSLAEVQGMKKLQFLLWAEIQNLVRTTISLPNRLKRHSRFYQSGFQQLQ